MQQDADGPPREPADCYLVGPDQHLCEVYAKGKTLCVEWARAKDARRNKLIRKKAQV